MNTIKNVEFFKAGKAIFTISNKKGEHYTYKIKKAKYDKNGNKIDNGLLFVSVMTGTDNCSHYSYIGILNPDTYEIKATQNSKIKLSDKRVLVLIWAISVVFHKQEIPAGYNIQHEGKCGRCGRRLTTPESIDSGFGPECINYINK